MDEVEGPVAEIELESDSNLHTETDGEKWPFSKITFFGYHPSPPHDFPRHTASASRDFVRKLS